ncbi:MAG: putative acylglycerol lipase [Ilumatobacteraceae bacterium]|nr:putative acylglycerol lipase [Ilumatobacteraceae bacterium]
MSHPILEGAEPWSHDGEGPHGALVIHGFTGNPSSMRGLAEALGAAGFHVEMPRLPGHGTHLDDMLTTTWDDWRGEAEAAYQRLAARSEKIVIAGLSMGGALTLRLGADHPETAGLICINAATTPLGDAAMVAMLQEFVDGGTEVMPGIGSDIADPDVTESAYAGAPVRPLMSLIEALGPLSQAYATMHVPLLILASPQDHVVPPEQQDYLAEHYAGPVERITLERSYHVATQDYDKQLIFDASVDFAKKVTAG